MDYQHRLSANTNVLKIQVVLKVLHDPRTGVPLQTEISSLSSCCNPLTSVSSLLDKFTRSSFCSEPRGLGSLILCPEISNSTKLTKAATPSKELSFCIPCFAHLLMERSDSGNKF